MSCAQGDELTAGLCCAETGAVLPAPGPGLRQRPGRHEVGQATAGKVLPRRLLRAGPFLSGRFRSVQFGLVM